MAFYLMGFVLSLPVSFVLSFLVSCKRTAERAAGGFDF